MKYPRHIFCGLRQIIQMALPYKRHTILLQRLSKNGYKPRMHIIVAYPLWCPILPPFMGISNLLSQATISGVMTAHLFVHKSALWEAFSCLKERGNTHIQEASSWASAFQDKNTKPLNRKARSWVGAPTRLSFLTGQEGQLFIRLDDRMSLIIITFTFM